MIQALLINGTRRRCFCLRERHFLKGGLRDHVETAGRALLLAIGGLGRHHSPMAAARLSELLLTRLGRVT